MTAVQSAHAAPGVPSVQVFRAAWKALPQGLGATAEGSQEALRTSQSVMSVQAALAALKSAHP